MWIHCHSYFYWHFHHGAHKSHTHIDLWTVWSSIPKPLLEGHFHHSLELRILQKSKCGQALVATRIVIFDGEMNAAGFNTVLETGLPTYMKELIIWGWCTVMIQNILILGIMNKVRIKYKNGCRWTGLKPNWKYVAWTQIICLKSNCEIRVNWRNQSILGNIQM